MHSHGGPWERDKAVISWCARRTLRTQDDDGTMFLAPILMRGSLVAVCVHTEDRGNEILESEVSDFHIMCVI